MVLVRVERLTREALGATWTSGEVNVLVPIESLLIPVPCLVALIRWDVRVVVEPPEDTLGEALGAPLRIDDAGVVALEVDALTLGVLTLAIIESS